MCIAVYLGSDIQLPTFEWDRKAPSFYATKANNDHGVMAQFSKLNVYYIGSHKGCGCGFIYEEDAFDPKNPKDVKEDRLRKESTKNLVEYLNEALERTQELELFICWEGEQGDAPKKTATITTDEIFGIDWTLDMREFYQVVRNKYL